MQKNKSLDCESWWKGDALTHESKVRHKCFKKCEYKTAYERKKTALSNAIVID